MKSALNVLRFDSFAPQKVVMSKRTLFEEGSFTQISSVYREIHTAVTELDVLPLSHTGMQKRQLNLKLLQSRSVNLMKDLVQMTERRTAERICESRGYDNNESESTAAVARPKRPGSPYCCSLSPT